MYSLKFIKLTILKIYIKINIVNNFIKSFKFVITILILFI